MSEQPYALSDEEIRSISIGKCNPHGGIYRTSVKDLANEAYALGVQRAREVKPLVWHFDAGTEQWLADSCSYDDGHAVWKGRDDNWYTRMEHDGHMYATTPTPFHLTEDAAKDACFQCHAEYVRNLLEPI